MGLLGDLQTAHTSAVFIDSVKVTFLETHAQLKRHLRYADLVLQLLVAINQVGKIVPRLNVAPELAGQRSVPTPPATTNGIVRFLKIRRFVVYARER